MKKTAMSLLLVTLASVSSVALADSWKDESGKGRHGREYKQEYWDGNCKVERKWEKDGDYKEKRKCKRQDRHYSERRYDDRRYDRPVVHQGYYPANSNYYPEYSRYDRRDPQVNIDIRIRQ
jgi:hypothetical protein